MTNLPPEPGKGNWQDLATESPKDATWDTRRGAGEDLADLVGGRYAERLDKCAQWLNFERTVRPETGEAGLRLTAVMFCQFRHCPVCAWRRSQMWKARFFEALDKAPTTVPELETAAWLLLTLTVRNCEITDLRATLKDMREGWRRLINRKAGPMANVGGWIRTAEITRGKDGSAHPHFHVLLAVPPSYFGKRYVSKAKWAEAWKDALRLDYEPVVDIRRVKPKGEHSAPAVAAAEVLKYATKAGDLLADKDWALELFRQTFRTRAIASGGWLKDALREDEETQQDLIAGEGEGDDGEADEAAPVVRFDWHGGPVKRYRRRREGA
ncbi:TPA: protein rep [Stenotrophomonas maltophilia]